MTPRLEEATLHAVRAEGPLTAAEALAWFTGGTAPGGQVIGYAFAARAADWIRVGPDGTAGVAHGQERVRSAADVLADAYELTLFDGERELRWLRAPHGPGAAVALGEDPAHLPPGRDVTADPPPRRGDTHVRLLAGTPHPHGEPGWTTLASNRYAPVHLPWAFTEGTVLTIETVEYLTEDAHGNIDVADTRTVGLRATTAEAIRVMTGAASTDPAGRPA